MKTTYEDGTQEWTVKSDDIYIYHRDNGPAIIQADGKQEWYFNSQRVCWTTVWANAYLQQNKRKQNSIFNYASADPNNHSDIKVIKNLSQGVASRLATNLVKKAEENLKRKCEELDLFWEECERREKNGNL